MLAILVTQICNISLKLSHFQNLQNSNLFIKEGTKSDPKNFRPISLLPFVSKTKEKVIYDQNMNYLRGNNIPYKFQFKLCKNSPFNSHKILLKLSFLGISKHSRNWS